MSYTVTHLISILFDFYCFILFVYILLSWFPHERGIMADIYYGLGRLCEPYLGLFRRFIPPIGGNGFGMDISPIVAILVLQLVVQLVVRLLSAL